MKDFYGPHHDIQNTCPHQGCGCPGKINNMHKALPPSHHDYLKKSFFGDGITSFDLSYMHDCTRGFLLVNISLPHKKSLVVYVDPSVYAESGYFIEKCPTFDKTINFYVDVTINFIGKVNVTR